VRLLRAVTQQFAADRDSARSSAVTYRISFVGHLSIDRNLLGGSETIVYGGGVLHGAVTARRLGAQVCLYTKCSPDDWPRFEDLTTVAVPTTLWPSATSTSIRNEYADDDPDRRTSTLLSRASSFEEGDAARIAPCDLLHVNPLWFGELPPELLPALKARAVRLGGDAQGFVRRPGPDGLLASQDWPDKARWLPSFDYFKVDAAEARILTGEADPRRAAGRLHDLGVRVVVLTHRAGVCGSDGRSFYEAPFAPYPLTGRTGRGDTCMAAFLVAHRSGSLAHATRTAAAIASKKMQYPGPYRG
jgi:sugar/nucleoside kinase (ribokinase family)